MGTVAENRTTPRRESCRLCIRGSSTAFSSRHRLPLYTYDSLTPETLLFPTVSGPLHPRSSPSQRPPLDPRRVLSKSRVSVSGGPERTGTK